METEDKNRRWAWWLLLVGVGLQFYFVQELVAAFAFFAIGFAALALVIVTLYMLQKGWEAAVARFTNREELSSSGLQAGRVARELP